MKRDEALYDTPVSTIMLMAYEVVRINDKDVFTLIERERIDNGRES